LYVNLPKFFANQEIRETISIKCAKPAALLTSFIAVAESTSLHNYTMDFPSRDWIYLDLDDFDTAPSDIRGLYTFELFAQLRPTGRILDHFRAVIGGTGQLDINASLESMIPASQFKGWRYKTQKQPADILLRRNMLSTVWADVTSSLLYNDASVYNATGEVVANDDFMEILENLPDAGPETAATRYCVVIGADRRPCLQFQSLPASAVTLSGKTAFKG